MRNGIMSTEANHMDKKKSSHRQPSPIGAFTNMSFFLSFLSDLGSDQYAVGSSPCRVYTNLYIYY